MKTTLLLLIRIYQILAPDYLRSKCLFKESCSNYVYRTIDEKGLREGFSAFKYRYYNCRAGYKVVKTNSTILFISSNFNIIDKSLIKESVINKQLYK